MSPEDSIHKKLMLDLDSRNNIHAEYGDYRTSMEGVFAAGTGVAHVLVGEYKRFLFNFTNFSRRHNIRARLATLRRLELIFI